MSSLLEGAAGRAGSRPVSQPCFLADWARDHETGVESARPGVELERFAAHLAG